MFDSTANNRKSMKRAASLIVLCATCAVSFALEPTSSANFRINYSVVPNGVGHLTSASFQARASAVGQTCPRFASTTLPVTVSVFKLD